MSIGIVVVYYSSTGTVHALAEAVAEGATQAGATVRLRKVAELAPDEVIRGVPDWHAHATATADVPTVTHDDLRWADGYVVGTPTRFGNIAAQLRQFLDTLSPVWQEGALANKPASGFTAAASEHGGHESTLLSLYQTFMHWGAVVVPQGYTDDTVYAAGGNPYGVSAVQGPNGPSEGALAAARYQGRRVATMADALRALRTTPETADSVPLRESA